MKKLVIITLLSVTALSGCARAKEELGLTRRTPDEFAVVKRAPLAIPPNLEQVTSLPTPQPGAQRPQETAPQLAAQQAVLGGPSAVAAAPSSGENALLSRAGAPGGMTNIRETVNREAAEKAEKERPVVKRIINLGNKNDPGPAVIVDAPAERDRIQSRKPGETPSIEE